MKKLLFAFSLFFAISANASAGGYAALTSCRVTTSVTGQMIYVGTYMYGGNYYTFTFRTYCPSVVELE